MTMKAKFKKGAASFYVVAFSTLILLIIATSFAAIIISAITRAANDDLSQSAYDSAMAGIEDAKLAFYNYQKCVNAGNSAKEPDTTKPDVSCSDIMYYVENPDCDMVGHILGRIAKNESGEVFIKETTNGADNNMMQAYTCNKLNSKLQDYRSTLSSAQNKVIQPKFEDGSNVVKNINSIRISWFSEKNRTNQFRPTTIVNDKIIYQSIITNGAPTPPTISVAMLQTSNEFTLSDFDITSGEQTDRGLIYLSPVSKSDSSKAVEHIGKEGFLKSNNHNSTNTPYAVYCPENSGEEFACSVTIELPEPVGGNRSEDTFAFILSLPYGRPATDFSLEFLCGTEVCGNKSAGSDPDTPVTNNAILSGVQVEVDSTGRANDLYRRALARLESSASDYPLSIMGPLELLGKGDDAFKKNFSVTTEYNF